MNFFITLFRFSSTISLKHSLIIWSALFKYSNCSVSIFVEIPSGKPSNHFDLMRELNLSLINQTWQKEVNIGVTGLRFSLLIFN